jgi:hypothetical protein
VYALYGYDRKLTLQKLTAILEEEGGADAPSPRTVRRLIDRFKALPNDEQEQYRYFSWPRSMEAGILPWEAAPAAFQLMRELAGVASGRPPVRIVKWFYRVTQAAPDAPFGKRHTIAAQLAVWEASSDWPMREVEVIEWYLAFGPWRSPEHERVYSDTLPAVGSVEFLPFIQMPFTDFAPGAQEFARQIQESLYGFPLSDRFRQWITNAIEGRPEPNEIIARADGSMEGDE